MERSQRQIACSDLISIRELMDFLIKDNQTSNGYTILTRLNPFSSKPINLSFKPSGFDLETLIKSLYDDGYTWLPIQDIYEISKHRTDCVRTDSNYPNTYTWNVVRNRIEEIRQQAQSGFPLDLLVRIFESLLTQFNKKIMLIEPHEFPNYRLPAQQQFQELLDLSIKFEKRIKGVDNPPSRESNIYPSPPTYKSSGNIFMGPVYPEFNNKLFKPW